MEGLAKCLNRIKQYIGKTIVIKYGGNAMINDELKRSVVEDVSLLYTVGAKPVIVHGGGPEITSMLKNLGIESSFISGLRVTDPKTAAVAEMVLAGKINPELVALLNRNGVNAVGLNGKDAGLIKAKKHFATVYTKSGAEYVDIGYVGDIEQVQPNILNILFDKGIVPVIAPTGADEDGNTYNINADYMAGEIAAALKAEILLLLTDTEGIYTDYKDKTTLLNEISFTKAQELIKCGAIDGGMIPKVESCISALREGAKQAVIIDGRIPHSILTVLFEEKAFGTKIIKKTGESS